ncbi:MAG: trypsin-like serine protease [Solirubrobacterales bacterium]
MEDAAARRTTLTLALALAAAFLALCTAWAEARGVALEVPPEGASASAAVVVPPERTRIVGGSTTTVNEYPWQVALVYDAHVAIIPPDNDFRRQFCGGTLITPQIVQTAAHCLVGTDPDDGGASDMETNDLDVVTGKTTLSPAGGQKRDRRLHRRLQPGDQRLRRRLAGAAVARGAAGDPDPDRRSE